MKISSETRLIVSPDSISSDLYGKTAVLDVESNVMVILSGAGARVWRLLEQPRTMNELQDILMREYDVEDIRCQKELRMVIDDLFSKGLLEIGPGEDKKV